MNIHDLLKIWDRHAAGCRNPQPQQQGNSNTTDSLFPPNWNQMTEEEKLQWVKLSDHGN